MKLGEAGEFCVRHEGGLPLPPGAFWLCGWCYTVYSAVSMTVVEYRENILGFCVFPKVGGTPKSSILIGFSIINHPFWGTTIFGNTHMFHIHHVTYFGWSSYSSIHEGFQDCYIASCISMLASVLRLRAVVSRLICRFCNSHCLPLFATTYLGLISYLIAHFLYVISNGIYSFTVCTVLQSIQQVRPAHSVQSMNLFFSMD